MLEEDAELVRKTPSKIAFISGHVNLTQEEFDKHYIPQLVAAIHDNDDFVVGSANGADKMAIEWLYQAGVIREKITVYVYERFPEAITSKVAFYKSLGLNVLIGFTSYTSRDARMTENSDYDIAWVRPVEENKKLLGEAFDPKKISGTQRNIERRNKKAR